MINKFKKLKEMKLSDSEKKDLFLRISKSIEKDDLAVKFKYPTLSPFYKRKHFRMVFMYSFLALFFLGTTAFASLDSLPGDMLYGVKTHIVEKIPSLLLTKPEDRAKNNSEKIEKRLKEFEKLAEKGRLTEEHAKNIEKNVKKNLKDFDAHLEKAKKQKREPRDAIYKNDLETELDSKLEKHSKKIKEIQQGLPEGGRETLQSVLDRAEMGKKRK